MEGQITVDAALYGHLFQVDVHAFLGQHGEQFPLRCHPPVFFHDFYSNVKQAHIFRSARLLAPGFYPEVPLVVPYHIFFSQVPHVAVTNAGEDGKKEHVPGKVTVGGVECGAHQFVQFLTGQVHLFLSRLHGGKVLERAERHDSPVHGNLCDMLQPLDMPDGCPGLEFPVNAEIQFERLYERFVQCLERNVRHLVSLLEESLH